MKQIMDEDSLKILLQELSKPISNEITKLYQELRTKGVSEEEVVEILEKLISEESDKFKGKDNYELWLEAGNTGTLEDYLKSITKVIEQDVGYIPDYSNIEGIDRIKTLDDKWIVDRDGFVYLRRSKMSGTYNVYNAWFAINGIPVTDMSTYITSDIVSIRKGDIITCNTDGSIVTGIQCRYIPPVSVPVPSAKNFYNEALENGFEGTYDEWISSLFKQSFMRCSGEMKPITIAAQTMTEITPIPTEGDLSLVDGNKFIAKVSGLYSLNISMATTINVVNNYLMQIHKYHENILTSVCGRFYINSHSSTISGNVVVWLNKDDYLVCAVWNNNAISINPAKFDFALLNSSGGESGKDGKDFYQTWLEAGHEGTIDDCLSWVKADAGGNGNIGEIFWWPLETPPGDSLYCDGRDINREEYKDLFEVIGTNFGVGNGTTTFNLPDLRGEFIRGYDPGNLRDPNGSTRGIGKHQDGTYIPHLRINVNGNIVQAYKYGNNNNGSMPADMDKKLLQTNNYYAGIELGQNTATSEGSNWAGYTPRPTNVNLLPCIRYKVAGNSVAIKVEYASNDDNSNNTAGVETAVNREDGSLGIKTTPESGGGVLKALKFPTAYNSATDILEIQLSTDRENWHSLYNSLFIAGSTLWKFMFNTSNEQTGVGLHILSSANEIFVTFGKYRILTSPWSAFTSDWYWRVVKKTFSRQNESSPDDVSIDNIKSLIQDIINENILPNEMTNLKLLASNNITTNEVSSFQKTAIFYPNGVPGNNFYINASTGNDTTGNGTSAKPWKTLVSALTKIPARSYSTNSTIYLSDGIYTVTSDTQLLIDFGAQFNIVGNTSDPSKVTIEQTLANARVMRSLRGAVLVVRGVTLKNNATHTANTQLVYAQYSGTAHFDGCIFEGNSQWTYGPCSYESSTISLNTCQFTGTRFKYLVEAKSSSSAAILSATIPNIITVDTAALNAYHNGNISIGGTSTSTNGISGATITGKKYNSSDYSRIGFINLFTNTCTIAGTTSIGGITY